MVSVDLKHYVYLLCHTPSIASRHVALAYDILPSSTGLHTLEEGAGKRFSECGRKAHSEHRFPAPSSKVCKPELGVWEKGCRKPTLRVLPGETSVLSLEKWPASTEGQAGVL